MKKIKLFCIPHAGGSSVAYMKWKRYLNDNIELVPVELAGRGRRMREEKYNSLNEAINDVFNIIKSKVKNDDDYMIYGHSMGCTIAYEVSCRIIEEGMKEPIHLFLSGRHCPFIDKKEKNIYNLNDDDFKEAVLALGGTPEEIFTNNELREIFVPIIRNDYKNIETFNYIHKDLVLPVSMTVLNGRDDDLSDEEINGWSKLTSREFKRLDFAGDHFFLYENVEGVVDVINMDTAEAEKKLRQDAI